MNHPDTGKHEDLQRIMDFAQGLGFHGIMILSPVCPVCRAVHHWNMLTDLDDSPDGHNLDRVIEVLDYHLDRARREVPRLLTRLVVRPQ